MKLSFSPRKPSGSIVGNSMNPAVWKMLNAAGSDMVGKAPIA
jgi:hypothetical protein